MENKFTPRKIAKSVAKSIVAIKTKQIAEDVITENTDFEKTDMIVKISTGLISGYVAQQVSPFTDYAVDKAADFIVAKREARSAKKNETDK